MREHRATLRAVSDDFEGLNENCEEPTRSQTSSEGALFGNALGGAGLDAAAGEPVQEDICT